MTIMKNGFQDNYKDLRIRILESPAKEEGSCIPILLGFEDYITVVRDGHAAY